MWDKQSICQNWDAMTLIWGHYDEQLGPPQRIHNGMLTGSVSQKNILMQFQCSDSILITSLLHKDYIIRWEEREFTGVWQKVLDTSVLGSALRNASTKFVVNLISSLSGNMQKLLDQSQAWKTAWEVPQGMNPSNLRSFWSEVCLELCRNCMTNQRSGKRENSVEQDQQLIRPWESQKEYINIIWHQSDEQYVQDCVDGKLEKLCRAWPKAITTGESHKKCPHQVWMQCVQWFCWKCAEISKMWQMCWHMDRQKGAQGDHSYVQEILHPLTQIPWQGTIKNKFELSSE